MGLGLGSELGFGFGLGLGLGLTLSLTNPNQVTSIASKARVHPSGRRSAASLLCAWFGLLGCG